MIDPLLDDVAEAYHALRNEARSRALLLAEAEIAKVREKYQRLMWEAWADGTSHGKIAKATGFSRPTVYAWVHEYDLALPEADRAKSSQRKKPVVVEPGTEWLIIGPHPDFPSEWLALEGATDVEWAYNPSEGRESLYDPASDRVVNSGSREWTKMGAEVLAGLLEGEK